MATLLADPYDVAVRWRELSDDEQLCATVLIEEATSLLAVSSPGLRDRAAASPDVAVAARSVIVSMVLRVMKNPDAIRQFTVDDYSQVRDQVASSGLLYATPEELAHVQPRDVVGLPAMYVVGLGG